MSRNWVAVASAEHVRIGRSNGFMQVCHGKAAPLRRIQPGDRVVYYSPTSAFRSRDGLQSFTALGVVDDGAPYQAEMGDGFSPFRRDVSWCAAREAPIKPLIDALSFIKSKTHWGAAFRFGQIKIPAGDFKLIAKAMGVESEFQKNAL